MIQTAIVIVAAYLLDLLLGDPRWFPHPVRGIGSLAGKLEAPLRRAVKDQRLAGVIFAVLITGGVYAACFMLLRLADHFHPGMGVALSIILIYTSLRTYLCVSCDQGFESPEHESLLISESREPE